ILGDSPSASEGRPGPTRTRLALERSYPASASDARLSTVALESFVPFLVFRSAISSPPRTAAGIDPSDPWRGSRTGLRLPAQRPSPRVRLPLHHLPGASVAHRLAPLEEGRGTKGRSARSRRHSALAPLHASLPTSPSGSSGRRLL